jgi:hypothetical protein
MTYPIFFLRYGITFLQYFCFVTHPLLLQPLNLIFLKYFVRTPK